MISEPGLRASFTDPPGPRRSRELALEEVLRAAWLRKGLVTLIVLTAIAAAYLLLQTLEPRYTASATLQLDSRATELTEFNSVVSQLVADAPTVESEMDVIHSHEIAARVVRALNLTEHPDLGPSLEDEGLFDPAWLEHSWIETAKASASNLVGKLRAFLPMRGHAADELPATLQAPAAEAEMSEPVARAGDSPPSSAAEATAAAIAEALLERLEVTNDGRSYTIHVRYTSEDPVEAAAIANAFASQYLALQTEVRREITRDVAAWLERQLTTARDELDARVDEIEAFREDNDLFGAGADGLSLARQQLEEVNQQLATVQTERARLEARADQATTRRDQGTAESLPEVVASPLIQNLRETQAALVRRRAELAADYGSRHPSMQSITSEIRDVEARVAAEIDRIVDTSDSALRTAVAREERLRARLDALRGELRAQERAMASLRQQERDAETREELVRSLARRHGQVLALVETEPADVRLISPAITPGEPSGPNTLAVLGAPTFLAGLLALLLAWWLERPGSGFRTAEEVEREIGVPCLGMVPNAGGGGSALRRWFNRKKAAAAYAAAVQRVGTSVQVLDPHNPPRVIVVTSSVPDEGKSMLAVSLGRHFERSGMRTLIVDADIHHPSVAEIAKPKTSADENGLMRCSERLDVLRLSVGARHKHDEPYQLLAADEVPELIRDVAKDYRVVIIDTPPVVLLGDALLFASLADIILYVVRWDSTPREAIAAGLARLHNATARIAGIVLSRVDLERHARYGIKDESYYSSLYAGRAAP